MLFKFRGVGEISLVTLLIIKLQYCSCAYSMFLWRHYIAGKLIVPSKENAVCTAAILDFVMSP